MNEDALLDSNSAQHLPNTSDVQRFSEVHEGISALVWAGYMPVEAMEKS
jgi:hypothetical protein